MEGRVGPIEEERSSRGGIISGWPFRPLWVMVGPFSLLSPLCCLFDDVSSMSGTVYCSCVPSCGYVRGIVNSTYKRGGRQIDTRGGETARTTASARSGCTLCTKNKNKNLGKHGMNHWRGYRGLQEL